MSLTKHILFSPFVYFGKYHIEHRETAKLSELGCLGGTSGKGGSAGLGGSGGLVLYSNAAQKIICLGRTNALLSK